MVVTILPFMSIFLTALHRSGTLPSGLEWPTDPQWGNFVEAFRRGQHAALLASSVLIVLGVVPISLVISTMAGFAIGLLRDPWVRGWLLLLFVLRPDAALRGDHHRRSTSSPEQIGILNTRLAIVLPLIGLVHAVCGVLDACPFRERAERDHRSSPRRRCGHLGSFPARSRARSRGRRSHHLAILMSCGLGTSSCWRWYSSRIPRNGRWRVPLGAFQGHYATEIPLLCARDRC